MSLYPHPLVPGYWREALRSFRSLRSVAFSAVMIAACIVLSRFYIPLHESLTLSVTFLARALCALVCGPLVAMVFAVALMVALVTRYNMTEMLSPEDFTMVKNPGKEDMEIIVKQGQNIDRYTPSEDQSKSGQRGKRVGIAYELENGEIIYVPE